MLFDTLCKVGTDRRRLCSRSTQLIELLFHSRFVENIDGRRDLL